MMNAAKSVAAFFLLVALTASCGTAKKATVQQESAPEAPGMAESAEAVKPFMAEGAEYLSFGYVQDGKSRIASVCINREGLSPDRIELGTYSLEKEGWVCDNRSEYPFHQNIENYGEVSRVFADSCTVDTGANPSILFRVLSSAEGSDRCEYSVCQFFPATYVFWENVFEGKQKGSPDNYLIEGRINPLNQDVPQLRQLIESNDRLVKLPEGDFLTDEISDWWTEHNPDAMSTATRISMAVIPEGCSLIEQFGKSKYTAESGKYKAAMFDYRDRTSVVAYVKADGTYLLIWTEDECKDHRNGRLLNSIRFDKGLLRMSYYHGKRSFSYLVNITSKTISRQ